MTWMYRIIGQYRLGGIALLANIDYSSQQPRHQMVLAVVLEVVVDEQVGEAMPEGCEVVGVLRQGSIKC